MAYSLTQHDGKFVKFGGQWIGKIKPMYTLTLQNDGNGTLTATKLTGYAGDTVTLTPTYNTYFRFSGYENTGGEIVGNTFTFGEDNATAKAYFSGNLFSASGYFPFDTTYYNPTLTYYTLYTGYTFPKILASSDNVPNTWSSQQLKLIWPSTGKRAGGDNHPEFDKVNAWYPTGDCANYNFSMYLMLGRNAGYNKTIGTATKYNKAIYVNNNLYASAQASAAGTSQYIFVEYNYNIPTPGLIKLSAGFVAGNKNAIISASSYDSSTYSSQYNHWSASGYAP